MLHDLIVISTVAKINTDMREAVSQCLSIALRYLATGNSFEDLKFLGVTCQSVGITVLETCVLLADGR
jgi:hypothetical protein